MTYSPDGFLRLELATLKQTDFNHIISVVEDEETSPAALVVSGYTEWASAFTPRISIGWDWQLSIQDKQASISKAGSARINVMLVDAAQGDLGFWQSVDLVDQFIDTLPWEHVVRAQLSTPLLEVPISYS
jgi:hypothetical protein